MSHQPESPSVSPRRTTRIRLRRRLLVAFGLLTLVGIWLAAPAILKWQVRRAIIARDLDSAEILLDRMQRWFSIDGESEFLRARLNRKRGNWSEVRNSLLQARKLKYPVDLLEREQWLTQAQSGQLRQVEARLPQLLTDPRDDGAEICEAFVNGYFLNHRMSEVVRLLDAWVADFPKDPEPLLIRGKIRIEQQFLKEAEADLQAASTLAPSSVAITLELANLLILERQVDSALEHFHKLVIAHPTEMRSRIGEAKCLRLLNRFPEARSAVQKVLELDPSNREGLVELGLVQLELEDYQDARATLQQALVINPRSLVVRQALARACRATGDMVHAREHAEYVAEAQAALAKADQLASRVGQRPHDADIRYEIGRIYQRYAVPERGVQWLRSALDCDPNHQAAKQALTEFLAKQPSDDSASQPMTPNGEAIPAN
jgi:Flp pilus assembly protein TadD